MSLLSNFCDSQNAFERGIIESSKPILRERLTQALRIEAQKVADEFVIGFISKLEIKVDQKDGVTRFIFEVNEK